MAEQPERPDLGARLRGLPADQDIQPGVTVAVALARIDAMMKPPETPAGSEWRPDVVYGTAGAGGRDLTLYVYARSDRNERRPGIVFIHGGGWVGGHPFMLLRHANEMAARGYVTATIFYRLSGEAKWPAALEDAKCAVRWMRANASEIGLDAERIAASGGSAGGHLAAMVALLPGEFEGSGGNERVSSAVQAAVLYNPALDLTPPGVAALDGVISGFLGDVTVEKIAEASPVSNVSSSCPPILTRVGDQDTVTPASHCRDFHRKLYAAGVPNRLEVVPGFGHGNPQADFDGTLNSTVDWLGQHLSDRRVRA